MKKKIPDKADWEGYKGDLDVEYLHKLAFGKPIDDVQEYFEGARSIMRADELLRAPRPIFQYYIFAYAQYLMSESAAGESDSASPFLSLLEEREKRDPGSVAVIYSSLYEVVDFVASNQDYFEANIDIYGSFQGQAERIRKACYAKLGIKR